MNSPFARIGIDRMRGLPDGIRVDYHLGWHKRVKSLEGRQKTGARRDGETNTPTYWSKAARRCCAAAVFFANLRGAFYTLLSGFPNFGGVSMS